MISMGSGCTKQDDSVNLEVDERVSVFLNFFPSVFLEIYLKYHFLPTFKTMLNIEKKICI